MFLRRFCRGQASLARFYSQGTHFTTKKVRDIGEANVGETVRIKASIIAATNVTKFVILLRNALWFCRRDGFRTSGQ